MWQAAYRGRKYRFRWLEPCLSALGFRLIFCWRNPNSFAEAGARRLRISSNPSQYDDLTIFVPEREIFQQLVEDSAIPKLLVGVTERSLEERIDYIADWLGRPEALIRRNQRPIVHRAMHTIRDHVIFAG
jgi:hypothetical protein